MTNIGGERLSTTNTLFVVVVTHNDGNIEIKRHLLAEISNWPSKNKKSLGDGDFKVGESFFYLSKNDSLELLPDDGLTVLLIDKSNNQVIWQSTLRGKPNIPPIVIGVTTKPSPLVKGRIGTIYVTLFDPDKADQALIDNYNVHLRSSSSWLNITLTSEGGGIYAGEVLVPSDIQANRYYPVTVIVNNSVDDETLSTSLEYIYVRTPIILSKGVWLNITEDSILLSDELPSHGDVVTVTVTVLNEGDTAAKFYLKIRDYRGYYDVNNPPPANLQEGKDYVVVYNKEKWWYVPASGVTTITVIWNVGEGYDSDIPVAGNHTLYVEAWNVCYLDDTPVSTPGHNNTYHFVTVLPKILLVDANGGILDDYGYSPVEYLESAMNSIDFDYTKIVHTSEDIVSTSGYDVVIWDAGYREGTPNSDQFNQLKDFYTNGGKVWVIASNYKQDATTQFGNLKGKPDGKILINYSASYDVKYSEDSGKRVYDASQIPSPASGATWTTEAEAIDSSNSLWKWPAIVSQVYNDTDGKYVWQSLEFSRIKNISDQSALAYKILMWLTGIRGKTGRDLAIGGIEITPSRPLYNQEVAINVTVRNNGMQNESSEVALYIDGEKIDTLPTGTIPAYGGEVYVTFKWVANKPGVHTLSVVVDPLNLIPETNEDNNYLHGIMPTKIEVLFSTLVIYDGTDTFSTDNKDIIVNAFNALGYAINDTTHAALMNDSNFGTGQVFSAYNLVIYVGGSGGDGTSFDGYLDTSSDKKDYNEIYNYIETYHGNLLFIGSTMPEDLDSAGVLDIFGVSIDDDKNLTPGDDLYGVNYENGDPFSRGMAYVVDVDTSYTWRDIDYLVGGSSTDYEYGAIFLDEYSLKESSAVTEGYGLRIEHNEGSKILIIPFDIKELQGFNTTVEGEAPSGDAVRAQYYLIFRAMMYFGQIEWCPELAVDEVDISVNDEHPLVGHSYVLSVKVHNYGDVGTSCLVRFYERGELIGSDSIYVGPKNTTSTEIIWVPMFGSFRDLITVTIDEINEVEEKTVEGIVGEVFAFNNIAKHYLTVYFFWDDLENGTANWNHDATILNINGESPLDFLNRKGVSTNVIGDWDWNFCGVTDSSYHAMTGKDVLGKGIYETNDKNVTDFTHATAHSVPKAFWLPEVPSTAGERIPLDVFLVVDNSASMDEDPDGDGNTKWDDLVNAIQNDILPYLTDNDYLTLIAFGDPPSNKEYNDLNDKAYHVLGEKNLFSKGQDSGEDSGEAVVIWYKRKPMTEENKAALINLLTSSDIVPKGKGYLTPLWDAIGVGIIYAKYYNDTEDYQNGKMIRYPLVIALSDGMDEGQYRGTGAKVGENDIKRGNKGPHGGSEVFGPWWPWGEKSQLNGDIISDDNGSVTNYTHKSYAWNWYPVELRSIGDKTRYGLLNLANEPDTGSPPHVGGKIPVFTIGLGLMHFSPPSSGKLKNTHYGHVAGSTEYWLWKIASTSPAKRYGVGYDGYMYAAQSSELGAIFQAIMTSIGGPGGVRASPHTHFDSSNVQSSKGANLRISSDITLMEEHFESGLGNWIASDNWDVKSSGSSQQPNWDAYDGEYYLIYKDDSDKGDYLIYYNSPLSIPSDATWAILSFAIRWDASDSCLHALVNDGDGWTQVGQKIGQVVQTPLNETSTSDDEWLLFSADLTPYIGKTIHIGFNVSDKSTSNNYFAIDDVKIIYGVREASGGSSNTYNIHYKKYRFLVTPQVVINDVEKVKLTFWTKYWMTEGTNGGVIYLWLYDSTNNQWSWDKDHRIYLTPKQSYTGNLMMGTDSNGNPIGVDKDADSGGPAITGDANGLRDKYGKLPYWCFNGRSSHGTFEWDYIEVPLTHYINEIKNHGGKFRIVFLFAQYGGLISNTGWRPEMGWYIDDVRITVSGGNTDYWSYVNNSKQAHSGSRYWYYCAPNGYMPLGVDSSLYTVPIDLTRAYKVTLIAYLKFNINSSVGLPPDGIRIEVSTDNGRTWKSITYGVRIGWNYSGKDTNVVRYINYYGINNDIPQAYSGVKGEVDINTHEFIENTSTGYGWIPSVTLARLNCDLSGFVGNTIILRFRVYTNATGSPKDSIHYDSANEPKGIYIDDVFVIGESVGGSLTEHSGEGEFCTAQTTNVDDITIPDTVLQFWMASYYASYPTITPKLH